MKKHIITTILFTIILLLTPMTFAEDLVIDQNGNVGIGTATPADRLHIFGAIRVGPDASNYARISGSSGNLYLLPIDTSGTVNIYKGGGASAEAARLRISDGSAYNLVLDGDGDCYFNTGGNVGIGTPTPGEMLVIEGNNPIIKFNDTGGANIGDWDVGINVNPGGIGRQYGDFLIWNQDENHGLIIQYNGNVGIGITNPSVELEVAGTIKANELQCPVGPWSDFVFEDDYLLKPIEQVESFIKENKHLPGIPSAVELKENGISVTDMLSRQMQKIEELTLYLVKQNKELQSLKKMNQELEARLAAIERGECLH